MNASEFIAAIDSLWPNHDMPEPVLAELGRRVQHLPLGIDEGRAALTEYRINSPKYETKTPHAGAIYQRLRAAAYPAEQTKTRRASDGPPADFQGRIATYRDWCEYARANGIKNHLGRIMGRTA